MAKFVHLFYHEVVRVLVQVDPVWNLHPTSQYRKTGLNWDDTVDMDVPSEKIVVGVYIGFVHTGVYFHPTAFQTGYRRALTLVDTCCNFMSSDLL